MNIEYFEKVKAMLRKYPDHFDMSSFTDIGPCGTTACIAGWAITLAYHDRSPEEDILDSLDHVDQCYYTILEELSGQLCSDVVASKILDIDRVAGGLLFFIQNWPIEFVARYTDARTRKDLQALANITCERIDHFIQHGK